jgi:galactokinase/CTP:molybdopterin cytidylyltransferase MocA
LITSDFQDPAGTANAKLGAELQKLAAHASSSPLEYLLDDGSATLSLTTRTLILLLRRFYGADEETLKHQLQRLASTSARFIELYGDGPVTVLRVPARINIMGEHIDYVSYLPTASLPFGSREHDMLMLYRASITGRVRGASTNKNYPPFVFSLAEGPAFSTNDDTESGWLSYLYGNPPPAPHWSNYVKAAVYFVRFKCGAQTRRGFDFIVDSNIPPGGGTSSSSALVVLTSAAVREVNRLRLERLALARDAAKAEWYVGTRGGSMDHITMCIAKRGHAVLIAYLEEEVRHVPVPGRQFRWVSFFSHAADKGREVMIEYNERAAVSRIIIPAVIDAWKTKQPERYKKWSEAVQSFRARATTSLNEIEKLLRELPDTLSLTEVEREYPEAFAACVQAFPALIEKRRERPLQVRKRALHHAGEVRRVIRAEEIMEGAPGNRNGQHLGEHIDSVMREVGTLLDQSHESLRDLYDVSTSQVERLVEIIRADPNVYGARLMGGGFGGNVLALTHDQNVSALIERVQAKYYQPQNRHGVREGSVMISTPGDGLASIAVESVWKEALERFNLLGQDAAKYRARMTALLDDMRLDDVREEVWPVIVAAGKGTRTRATGLDVPKPLALVKGTPAILHVIRNIRLAVVTTRAPIVIVSPNTKTEIREALLGEEVTFVLQPEALGTGDAVMWAQEEMHDFRGRALIIWGTQPVIQSDTIQRALKLAHLFDDYEMILPTALKEKPYAPLLRDDRGRVSSSRETHLESAGCPEFGESNVGLFLLKSEAMFGGLRELKDRYWNQAEQSYRRPGGELGFPNELINYFAKGEKGVFACPIADSREEQGIKTLEDVARCEGFISALVQEQS